MYQLIQSDTEVGYYVLSPEGKIINFIGWVRLDEVCKELAEKQVVLNDYYEDCQRIRAALDVPNARDLVQQRT